MKFLEDNFIQSFSAEDCSSDSFFEAWVGPINETINESAISLEDADTAIRDELKIEDESFCDVFMRDCDEGNVSFEEGSDGKMYIYPFF